MRHEKKPVPFSLMTPSRSWLSLWCELTGITQQIDPDKPEHRFIATRMVFYLDPFDFTIGLLYAAML